MSVQVGKFIAFVDPIGKTRDALVTAVWGKSEDLPAINVVIINGDENQTDSYGRKLERYTSVVHQSKQSAHGNYWK